MERSELLKKIQLFVLDLDGTFYLGDRILPDSLRFLGRVRESGRRFVFFTNNSSKTPEAYVEKLNRMGAAIGRGDIITSGDVCIDYLINHHAGASVYLMGTAELRASFADAGVDCFAAPLRGADRNDGGSDGCIDDCVDGCADGGVDVVVAAFDTELTYRKLERACTYIRQGAVFLATHEDVNCPTEDGFIPDCGSMCAAISLSTGQTPKYLGKPHPETVEKVEAVTGVSREQIAFVGDRLYTDVASGVNNGATGILVLSGETKAGDVERSPIRPHAVFSGLGEIADLL